MFQSPSFFQFKVMRKLLFLVLFLPLALFSQSKFGYFSYATVLDSLPQYKVAMDDYEKLKKRCLKEIEHNEQELTRFYVAFLDGHRDFPEPILRKRQKELQQLIDNSVVFRDQLKVWLRQAKDSLAAPSRMLVDSALQRVCTELSLMYAVNVDARDYRYINPQFGQDITEDLVSVILYPERPLRVVEEISSLDSVCVATDGVVDIAADSVVVGLSVNDLHIQTVVDSVAVDTIINR